VIALLLLGGWGFALAVILTFFAITSAGQAEL
jgi:hypothetical protein